MAGKAEETERLLEEYSCLQKMIASHRATNRMVPVSHSKRRRINNVDEEKKRTLLQEYSELKYMIDRHKQRNLSRRFSATKKTSAPFVPIPTPFNYDNVNRANFINAKSTRFSPSATLLNNTSRYVVCRQHIKPNITLKKSPVPIPSTSQINCTRKKNDISSFQSPKSNSLSIPSSSKMHYNSGRKTPTKSAQSTSPSIPSTSKIQFISTKKETTPVKSRYKLVRSAKTKSSLPSTPRMKYRSGKYAVKYVSQRNTVKIKAGYSNSWNSNTKRKYVARTVNLEGTHYKLSRNKFLKSSFETPKSARSLARSRKRIATSLNGVIKKQQIIMIKGVKFSMAAGGKSLRRIDNSKDSVDSASSGYSTPSVGKVSIGGVTYCETQPGMLTPSPYHRRVRYMANRVLNRSINHLTTAKRKSKQYCLFFNKFGTCTKHQKGTCPFIHDSSKVAVCKRFLHGGCKKENCQFSHELCVLKMPVCNFFLNGRCRTDTCPYLHVNVNPDAGVCEDFQKGYCPNGQACKKWHVTNKRNGTTIKKKRKRSIVQQKEPRQHSENPSSENSACLPTFIPLSDSAVDKFSPTKIENKLRIQPEFLLNSCSVQNN